MTIRRMLTPFRKINGLIFARGGKKTEHVDPCGNLLLLEPEQTETLFTVSGYKNGAS